MTLRALALILVVVMALPAMLAILRLARAAHESEATPGRRALETLWVVLPVAFLLALVAFAVGAQA